MNAKLDTEVNWSHPQKNKKWHILLLLFYTDHCQLLRTYFYPKNLGTSIHKSLNIDENVHHVHRLLGKKIQVQM